MKKYIRNKINKFIFRYRMKRFAKSIGLKAKFFSKKEIREEMEKFLQLDPKERPMKPPKDTIFYQTLIKNKEE